jgi:hypothetical protein
MQEIILVLCCVPGRGIVVMIMTIRSSAIDAAIAIATASIGSSVERRAPAANATATATIATASGGQPPWLGDGNLPFTLPHDPSSTSRFYFIFHVVLFGFRQFERYCT